MHERRTAYFTLLYMAIVGCSEPNPPTAPVGFAARASTTGVCHIDDTGAGVPLSLPPRAASRHVAHGDRIGPCLIDFETPAIQDAEIVDPYSAMGVTFTVESFPEGTWGDEVVGLAWNSRTSACVDPPSMNQVLATGRSIFGVGQSDFPIRASFQHPVPRGAMVSATFQTAAGVEIRIRLFDESGMEVASRTSTAAPPGGSCGLPGSARARTVLDVSAPTAVYSVIIDLPDNTFFHGHVFVIDDFSFGHS